MYKTAIWLFAITLLVTFAIAQDIDPIAEELNKAKQAYDEALLSWKKKLGDDFQNKLKELAEKNADLQTLKQIKAEHEAFKSQGKLPTSNWMKAAKTEYGNALLTPCKAMETASRRSRLRRPLEWSRRPKGPGSPRPGPPNPPC